MASLDKQLAQALTAITMLSNSMVSMQQQVSILTQTVAAQQHLQPIMPAHLSLLNVPLPTSPPSPPQCSSLHLQSAYNRGSYMFPPQATQTKEPKIAMPVHFTGK